MKKSLLTLAVLILGAGVSHGQGTLEILGGKQVPFERSQDNIKSKGIYKRQADKVMHFAPLTGEVNCKELAKIDIYGNPVSGQGVATRDGIDNPHVNVPAAITPALGEYAFSLTTSFKDARRDVNDSSGCFGQGTQMIIAAGKCLSDTPQNRSNKVYCRVITSGTPANHLKPEECKAGSHSYNPEKVKFCAGLEAKATAHSSSEVMYPDTLTYLDGSGTALKYARQCNEVSIRSVELTLKTSSRGNGAEVKCVKNLNASDKTDITVSDVNAAMVNFIVSKPIADSVAVGTFKGPNPFYDSRKFAVDSFQSGKGPQTGSLHGSDLSR